MNILGISCFYHDSAICYIKNGEIIAAAEEERFTRKKNDFDFPINSINWCFKEHNISSNDFDFVVFYDKPLLKFERILETAIAYTPRGINQFMHAIPLWLQKIWTFDLIKKELNFDGKILFAEHHESHAASAFYPSPFKNSAFLTIDGVGEWNTTCFGIGNGNNINILQTLDFPHSLGLLYSAFTFYTGFKVNSGEYKLMGLAPYGEPKYFNLILDELLDLKEDGSFKLNMKYFGYCNSLNMINQKFCDLFFGPARKPETKISQKEMDIAASIQKVTEEIILRMVRYIYKETGEQNLCLAGGVALNCVANSNILRNGPFKEIWIQPASNDAGGALGSALLIWHKYLKNERTRDNKNDKQKGSLLGPSYSDDYVENFLIKEKIIYKKLNHSEIPEITSDLILQNNIIGWFQGRMEFGPRALGSRSIIADPRNSDMRTKINSKIKYRESFRPFALTILNDELENWFDLNKESPYMLLTGYIKDDKKIKTNKSDLAGFDKLKVNYSIIPSVTHVDFSSRIQTIKRHDNPLFYDVIYSFFKKTGCPIIINTSFNIRGEPDYERK